jgi:hypothetical protein
MKKSISILQIGYWNDAFNESYIWPQEIENKMPQDVKAEVVKYLKSGYVFEHYKGYSSCRICGETLGSTDRTDGIYLWPDKLEHYVEKHGISLPFLFVERIKVRNGIIDAKPLWLSVSNGCDEYKNVYPSDSLWKKWCSSNRDLSKTVTFEKFDIPKPTCEITREISPSEVSDLFFTIEFLDDIVDVIEVPTIKTLSKLEGAMDYDGKMYNLWTSEVILGKPIIKAIGRPFPRTKYKPMSAFMLIEGTTVIYCNTRESMFAETIIEKRYCPLLGKQE